MFLKFLVVGLSAYALSQIAVFSTTIYLHRSATHHSVELRPAVAWVFRFLLWLTTGIRTKEWVAVHNKHHAHTDVEGDPHSPLLEGFWQIQIGNVFYYLKAARDPEVVGEYGQSVVEDRWDRVLFNHGLVGLGVGISLLCWWLGFKLGLAVALIHTITYVFVMSSSINGIGHTHGYKNFPEHDGTNFLPKVPVVGGENLHNNHHRYATSPKFSCRPGEVDPAWPFIRFLVRRGWATRKPTIEEIEERRSARTQASV